MANKRHLDNAPIKEALIDIQFEPAASLEQLQLFASQVKELFDQKVDLWQQTFGFELSTEAKGSSHVQGSVMGVRLDSAERHHVIQAKLNGFTFSKLAPYTEWAELRSTSRKMWDQFAEIVKPKVVKRIAVRYINEIALPLPINDFAEYLTASPQVPAALPQGVTAFLQRLIITDSASSSVATVTQALEESQASIASNKIIVFLDIDTFMVTERPPNADELWAELDILRNFKNEIFFEHITEKTAELFQ